MEKISWTVLTNQNSLDKTCHLENWHLVWTASGCMHVPKCLTFQDLPYLHKYHSFLLHREHWTLTSCFLSLRLRFVNLGSFGLQGSQKILGPCVPKTICKLLCVIYICAFWGWGVGRERVHGFHSMFYPQPVSVFFLYSAWTFNS